MTNPSPSWRGYASANDRSIPRSPHFVLAPLAGFTDASFRSLATHYGADLTYTEMVSAAGLAHGSSPTRHLLELLPDEGPVACQIFGNKPGEVAFAAREISKLKREGDKPRFVALDLNAGCPVPRIVKEGSGAALVCNPEKIHTLLKAMVDATDLPVTLKTRPGPKPDKVLMLELLAAAEEAGAQGITLHARFTNQCHGGPVHLNLLAELVAKSCIPVTGNGGVTTRREAQEMSATGVAAIMIGRGALAKPWFFSELKKIPIIPPKSGDICREHLKRALALREQTRSRFPNDPLPSVDAWAGLKLHTHLFRYFTGLPGAGALRRQLNSLRTLSDIESAISSF